MKFTNKMGRVKWAVHRKKRRNPGCKFYPPSAPYYLRVRYSLYTFYHGIRHRRKPLPLASRVTPRPRFHSHIEMQPRYPNRDEFSGFQKSTSRRFDGGRIAPVSAILGESSSERERGNKNEKESDREKEREGRGRGRRKDMNRMFLTEIWTIVRDYYLNLFLYCINNLCYDYS